MHRTRRIGVLAVLTVIVAACTSGTQGGDATGRLVMAAEYAEPPAGQPISIGGYGFFVSVDGEPEVELPFDGFVRLELPVGSHDLTFVTRPASDVLIVNEEGESEREFYDVSAECEQQVEVPVDGEVQVTYEARGGEECRVTVESEA